MKDQNHFKKRTDLNHGLTNNKSFATHIFRSQSATAYDHKDGVICQNFSVLCSTGATDNSAGKAISENHWGGGSL